MLIYHKCIKVTCFGDLSHLQTLNMCTQVVVMLKGLKDRILNIALINLINQFPKNVINHIFIINPGNVIEEGKFTCVLTFIEDRILDVSQQCIQEKKSKHNI